MNFEDNVLQYMSSYNQIIKYGNNTANFFIGHVHNMLTVCSPSHFKGTKEKFRKKSQLLL